MSRFSNIRITDVVIPAQAGIQSFRKNLDCPIKSGNDKIDACFFKISLTLLLCLFAVPAFAEKVTFTKEYTYQASEFDSKASSRILALEQVKRLILEEIGIFITSETEVKDFHLTRDQIVTYTAGIVTTFVVDEKWDGKIYWLKATVSADTNEVTKAIDKIRRDVNKSLELEQSKKKSEDLAKEVERLKKELTGKTDGTTIKQYNDTVNKLSALDWLKLAFTKLQGQNEENYKNSPEIKEAIEALSKVIDSVPTYSLPYYLRGSLLIFLDEYVKSIKDLDKAINLNNWNDKDITIIALEPEDIEDQVIHTCEMRALAYFKLGRYDLGIKDLDFIFDKDPRNFRLYEPWVKEIFDNYIKKIPKDYRGYLYRGKYLRANMWKDNYLELAIADYKKVTELFPQSAIGYYFLADGYWITKKDIKLALKTINKATKLKMSPILASAVFLLKASIHSDVKEAQNAINAYEQSIKNSPMHGEFFIERAIYWTRQEEYSKAIEDYTDAINAKFLKMFGHKKNDAVRTLLGRRGDTYSKIGNYKKAIEDYNAAIEMRKRKFEGITVNPFLFLADDLQNRGIAYYHLGNYQSAIEDFSLIIQVNSFPETAYEYRGNSFMYMGKYQEAINDYTKAIEHWQNKDHDFKYLSISQLYTQRGNVYLIINEYKKALDDFDSAINLNAQNWQAFFLRGSVYYSNIINNDAALKDFNYIIQAAPQNSHYFLAALVGRGATLIDLGRSQEALTDFNKAISMDPKNDHAYFNRGRAYMSIDSYQKGKDDLITAARLGNKPAQDILIKVGEKW
ncbi:MAG: tetratricopeptide repeat protein [Nitrospirae bacterium]|nr:tetratricopeptide repeat protein [Nitrospirota bacterium]